MIIDHFNSSTSGGAATAAHRLHQGLCAAGVKSRLWCKRRSDPDSGWDSWKPAARCSLRRIWDAPRELVARGALKKERKRELRGRPSSAALFSGVRRPYETPWKSQTADCLIHLHWTANFLDYPTFFASLSQQQPIIWTLHDANPLTGGCHLTNECSRFADGCGNCPQLGRPHPDDWSARTFRLKQQAYAERSVHWIAPSHWIKRQAELSGLFGKRHQVQVIPHGLDLTTFRPIPRCEARETLGLPPDRTIIAFGAASLDDKHKGMQDLVEALHRTPATRQTTLLLFGAIRKCPTLPMPHQSFGYLEDARQQALILSSSDIFVIPSHTEVLGLAGLEAMACGATVIGTRVGGIPDYVHDEKTGLLVPPRDPSSLSAALTRLLQNRQRRTQLAEAGARLVRREFDLAEQTRRHITLYEQVAEQTRHMPRSAA
jgi:glycosyltransferase involved in cell wall biosynthesis